MRVYMSHQGAMFFATKLYFTHNDSFFDVIFDIDLRSFFST